MVILKFVLTKNIVKKLLSILKYLSFIDLLQIYYISRIEMLFILVHITCLPNGSGLVIVVPKYPSHSSLPYKPAQ